MDTLYRPALWALMTAAAIIPLCVSCAAETRVTNLSAKCDFSNDPRFKVLAGKVPLSPAQVSAPPTLAEISNNSKPTPQEKAALLELDKAGKICVDEAMAIADRHLSTGMQGMLREVRLANLNLQRLLLEGKITYGHYRQNAYQLLARSQQVLGEYERAERAANVAAKQAAAAQLNSTMQLLQAFNRSPTITTCNRIGFGITCTSH